MSSLSFCVLCGHSDTEQIHRLKDRQWWRCHSCELIFVPPEYHLPLSEEKARYDTHQNVVGDPDYCSFLDRLCQPLMKHLPAGASGLDFGSGPGPALADMMSHRGFPMSLYDLYYSPDTSVLEMPYDFVTCTETVEHFREPLRHWDLLISIVKPNGYLGIMTQTIPDTGTFANWYYIRDLTHLSFYSTQTFEWLASHYALNIVETAANIVIFQKSLTTAI